ncbi:MAG TPA: BamA/TamA family outer membrane protein [Steroidobacteraceae bacterium]|nr:BamA/TamA family outer membrane protein [Steroidobacteraceae bacterium]
MKSTIFTFLVLGALGWVCSARAADPQAYQVNLASVGNNDIDQTLKETSDLLSLRTSAPVSPFGLIARARSDTDRLKTALESFGYYESHVTININGLLLTDPGLGDALTALPKGSSARVTVSFALGTLYHLRRIVIDGEVPAPINALETLGLTAGQPAVAASVLAGGARLLTALQEQGYAFAQVDPPVAYEAADAPVLDLSFHVTAGAKVRIGDIHVEGLKRVHESLVRRRLLLHSGDLYRPSVIEASRRDLLGMNIFGQVSVLVGSKADESGGVPITFKLRERLRHAISVSAAYSSDLGGSGGVTWTDRNLFGNAEQLSVAATLTNLGGSDTTGTGYDTGVKYLIPDFLHRDQSLLFAVQAIKQQLQAYDQKAQTASVTLSRKLSSVWTVSAGLSTTDETILQVINTSPVPPFTPDPAATFNYTLIAMPFKVIYDSTNLPTPLEDPRHGFRASLSLTPTLAIGHPNATFLISTLTVSTYFDLNNLLPIAPGRSVLAARGLAGVAEGAGELSLPPDQRFYAGGTSTIRGYGYQLVGPMFPHTDNPTGGTAITTGGLEFRQRLYTNWGVVAFVDAGQVSASLKPLPDDIRVGTGAGMRYYTPIGPIRFDIAVPVGRRQGEDSFEVYVGLGQAF